jgi:hypothetical protein
MDDYIDDALGANSGSNPLAGGFAGFVFQSEQANCRGYVDHFQLLRQT